MKLLFATLILFGSISTFAQGMKEHPCSKVKAACESAGFKKGEQKEGKSLWKDCVDPIMQDKTVAGVKLSKEALDACKSKHIGK